MSQSPSLRGSGRFARRRRRPAAASGTSQSPSLRGSGRFEARREAEERAKAESQSPSLRGSGRFWRGTRTPTPSSRYGLNPLHCGAVVASRSPTRTRKRRNRVSIPFIAGQWSLRGAERGKQNDHRRLNPLHCGAVVASCRCWRRAGGAPRVSIPFIAGQWSLLRALGRPEFLVTLSQSPSLRGSGRFYIGCTI